MAATKGLGTDNSVYVGYADGSVRSWSPWFPGDGSKPGPSVPGSISKLHMLNEGHLIATVGEVNYLVAEVGAVYRLPWKWITVHSHNAIAAIENGKVVQRTIVLPKVGPTGTGTVDLPADSIKPFGGFGANPDTPLTGKEADVTVFGGSAMVVTVGFADGSFASWVGGQWTKGDTRSVAVTSIGSIVGAGFADGTVDTGRLGSTRYRKCGMAAVTSLVGVQGGIYTVAVNATGEAWIFYSNVDDTPRRTFINDDLGQVYAVIPVRDYLTFVVGERAIAFYTDLKNNESRDK